MSGAALLDTPGGGVPADNNERLRVLFICKGSATVGLGHVMRTRSIALAMTQHAEVRVLLIGEERIMRTMLEGHVECAAVADDDAAAQACTRFEPDVVVFDMLEMDAAVFAAIRLRRLAVSTSPIFNRLADVDVVFSRAEFPGRAGLPRIGGPVVRTGLRYATIAEHCRRIPTAVYERHVRMEPLSVAICMGGADAPNRTLRILEAVRTVQAGLLIWVLLGEEYAHSYQQLVDCVSDDKRHEIILARTTDSMWRVLGQCSVAVLAGGITTFEAAYAGVPSIVALDDPAKSCLIAELTAAGACRYAGAPMEQALQSVVNSLIHFDEHRDALMMMHRTGKSLIDNAGAKRIAREIVGLRDSGARCKHTDINKQITAGLLSA